ncbi:calcium-activated chloride channel regulator 3A-1-like isoform X1 [Rhipicephalus microplus]|uniref:calcium-activated chloride channel regulator 3A-1-like isoform X1 n=2 Tax=Rhipicephalus microplus TaxID=6941 RepID=UPI003F6D7841
MPVIWALSHCCCSLARANLSKRIETTFEEMQHTEDLPQRVVMALDVSDSMKGDNRMTFLKDALTRYVRDIADGSKSLAIVTFSSSAAVLHPLMPVNVSTRQSFLNAVKDLKAAGQTCIGCGLQRTLQVLNTTDEKPEGGIVVLMSDSEENMTPKLNDVLPELMAAKVGVSTIAMGTSADHEIETLATMTDGKAFFFPGLQANTAILLQIAFEESTIRGDHRVDIRIANFAKAFTTRLEEKFILDSSLGKRTVVIFDQLNPTPTDVSLVLIDPSGRECKKCVEHGNKKTKTVFVPSPAQVTYGFFFSTANATAPDQLTLVKKV